MRIYIAAPWADKDQMPRIAAAFEAAGQEITHKWWEVENLPEAERSPELLRNQADSDVQGVVDAKVLVLLNTSKSEGKATEQGIAIGLDKPIVAVGKLGALSQNVFHYLPRYHWVDDIPSAIQAVRLMDWCHNYVGR